MATGDNQLSARNDELSTTDDQLVDDYLRRLRAAAGSLPADRLDELVGDIQAHIAEARASGPPGGSGGGAHVRNVLERLGQPEDIALAAAQPGSGYAGPDSSTSHPAMPGPSGPGTSGSDPAGSWPGRATPGSAGAAPLLAGDPGPSGSVSLGPSAPSLGANDPSGPGTGTGDSGASGTGLGGSGFGGSGPGGGGGSGGHGQPPRAPSPGLRAGPPGLDVLTVVLLLFGGLVVGIGWLAGVVLLWASPRWRTSDKVLGTLIWPGGLAGVLVFLVGAVGLAASSGSCASAAVLGAPMNVAASCSTFGMGWLPGALAISILGIAILAPIVVAIRLLRRARQAIAEPTVTLGPA